MANLAIVENGLVVDRLLGEAGFRGGILCTAEVGIGWLYEGDEFSAPPEPEMPPKNPFVPLKPYQFWGAVRALGHEQDLKDWVATIADPVQRGIASAMLEFSLEFRRDHPLIEAARVHLGMTEAELDDLWLWGLTL